MSLASQNKGIRGKYSQIPEYSQNANQQSIQGKWDHKHHEKNRLNYETTKHHPESK